MYFVLGAMVFAFGVMFGATIVMAGQKNRNPNTHTNN